MMRKSRLENGWVYTNVALIDTKLEELDVEQEIEWYPCAFEWKTMKYIREYIEDDVVVGSYIGFVDGTSAPTSLDYDDLESKLGKPIIEPIVELKNTRRN